jgi:hypothetical protein
MIKITPLVLLGGAIVVFPLAFVLDRVARLVGISDTSTLLSIVYLIPIFSVMALGLAVWRTIRTRTISGQDLVAMVGGFVLTCLTVLSVWWAWTMRDF